MTDEPTEQSMGTPQEGPKARWTRIRFIDGSALTIWWDGRHTVSWNASPVVIYQPDNKITAIPWHRIDRLTHKGRDEEGY